MAKSNQPRLPGPDTDSLILSYNDEVLYSSDLAILRSPTAFINDRLISFFFTHLCCSLSPPSTLLLPPSLSFLLSLTPDPAPILSPLPLPSSSLILFPVNDNADPTIPNAGSHWSLLIYHRQSNSFVHHDSLGISSNGWCARRLWMNVRECVGREGERGKFVEGPTPRQRNGYDCGLFVMAIAKKVCEWVVTGGGGEGLWFGKVEREVDGERVGRLRGELLELVLGLVDDAKKRRKD